MKSAEAQPELEFDPRPREIVTDSSEEFFALCARAVAGEFQITAVRVGDGPAQWICEVEWLCAPGR